MMKKILTILWIAVSAQLFAQDFPITGINIALPVNPEAMTANWGNGTSVFSVTATAKPDPRGGVNKYVIESRILVTIKKGGNKICGSYSPQTAPLSNFTTLNKVWSGKNAVSLLGQDCTLDPGDYELCVQFFGIRQAGAVPGPISEERCRQFTIKSATAQDFQAPQAISPADGSDLGPATSLKPVTFRWTPVVPRPGGPVAYRLNIWQLMQGQNKLQAMQANQPMITKDIIDMNQAIIANLITGPCRPPYLCDFVWNVQALDRQNKPLGRNNGQGEPFTFRITDKKQTGNDTLLQKMTGGSIAEFKIDSAICLKKENGLFRYHIWAHYENKNVSVDNILLNDSQPFAGYPANPNPGPGLNLRNNIRMKSGSYNGALTMNDIIDASSGTISNIVPSPSSVFTPALLAPNNIHNFQFDYSTSSNSPVQFTYYGLVDDALKDKSNRNTRNEIDSLKYPGCPCSACDEITIDPKQTGQIQNNGNGSLSLSVNLSAAPKKVKRIKADLVYFDMKPDDDNCLVCNKNSNTFGNFITAGISGSGFTGGVTAGHTAQFDALGDISISSGIPVSFSISIPPLVNCCNAKLNFCIRYIITFEDCTVCNVLVCYPFSITGCPTK